MLSNRDHLYGQPTSRVGLPSEHVPNLLCEVNAPRNSVDVSIEYHEGGSPATNPREEARAISLKAEAAQKAKEAKLKAFQEVLSRRVKAMALEKKKAAAAAAAASPLRRSAVVVTPPRPLRGSTKHKPPPPPPPSSSLPPAPPDASAVAEPDAQQPPSHQEPPPLAEEAGSIITDRHLDDSHWDGTDILTDVALAAHEGDASTMSNMRDDEDSSLLMMMPGEEKCLPPDEPSLVERIVNQSIILDEFARANLLRHKKKSPSQPADETVGGVA